MSPRSFICALDVHPASRRPTARGRPNVPFCHSERSEESSPAISSAPNTATRHWPYGAPRTPAGQNPPTQNQTDKLYTGQQTEPGDAALGLYNYKARFYSTVLGRFVSADSTADGLNRYAYAAGDPVRYKDPTGHCALGRATCSKSETIEYLTCGSGGACHAPDGVTAENWRAFTRWAIGQHDFWEFVAEDMITADVPNYYRAQIVGAIANNATDEGFRAISLEGFAYLAATFDVEAVFFIHSLYNITFNQPMSNLSREDLIGASPWWKDIGWELLLLQEDGPFGQRPFERELADATINFARTLPDALRNEEPWSRWQRNVALAGAPELNVSPEYDPIHPLQDAAKNGASCIPGKCLENALQGDPPSIPSDDIVEDPNPIDVGQQGP